MSKYGYHWPDSNWTNNRYQNAEKSCKKQKNTSKSIVI